MRPPLEPSPAQGRSSVWLLAGFELHGVGGEASDLHPQPIDVVPIVGGEDLRNLGAGDRLAPHSDRLGDDLDVGILGEDLLRRLGAERVHRCSRHAGDQHDVALAVELLDQPFGRDATCLLLIDRDVVGAGLGDLRIIGKDHHALVAGILDRGVERIGRDRKDHDGLGAGLHHGIDLLDLALRIRAGDLDFEVDLVGACSCGRPSP